MKFRKWTIGFYSKLTGEKVDLLAAQLDQPFFFTHAGATRYALSFRSSPIVRVEVERA